MTVEVQDTLEVPLDDRPNWPKPDDTRLGCRDVTEIVIRAAFPDLEVEVGRTPHLEGVDFRSILTNRGGLYPAHFIGLNIGYRDPTSYHQVNKRVIMRKKDRTINLTAIREAWREMRDQYVEATKLRDESYERKKQINSDWRELSDELGLPWQISLLTDQSSGIYSLHFSYLDVTSVRFLVESFKDYLAQQ